jgi:hypothetical protein
LSKFKHIAVELVNSEVSLVELDVYEVAKVIALVDHHVFNCEVPIHFRKAFNFCNHVLEQVVGHSVGGLHSVGEVNQVHGIEYAPSKDFAVPTLLKSFSLVLHLEFS